MASSVPFKQDMPPEGGYPRFHFTRRQASLPINGKFLSGFCVFSIGFFGWVYMTFIRDRERLLEAEMRDTRVAVLPFVEAERDRMQLKQLRRNRDWEEELMKDVPGWEVGTVWGEPLYHNKHNVWMPPRTMELYAHNRVRDMKRRMCEDFYRYI